MRRSTTVSRVSVYFRTRAEALKFAREQAQAGRRVNVRFDDRQPARVGSGRRAA